MANYAVNRQFSDKYMLRAMELIGRSSMSPVSDYVDQRLGSDLYIAQTSAGTVGMRTRKHSNFSPWDFTIRCKNAFGGETEYQKFRNGLCDKFFYGVLNREGTDYEKWILVNMHVWRAAMSMNDLNIANGRPALDMDMRANGDGTAFYIFNAADKVFRARPILIDCHDPRDFPGRVSFAEGAGRSFFPRRPSTSLFANDNNRTAACA